MAAPLVSLAALSALAESSSDEDAFDLDADVDAFLAASAERRAGRAPRCTADEQRRRKALTDRLAVAVASSHTDTQIKFTTQSIKMVLGPLLRVTPSVGLSQRVRIAAIELIQGTQAMNFRLFPALVRELRNAGFGVVLKTCNAAEMNEVIRRKAEADHKLREKGVAAHNKKAFDASALKLPKAKRTEIFLVGWTVTFPTTKKMLCGGGLKPVIAADFATAKGTSFARRIT
ncbi:hypothetical protein M885DRAFT_590483 [Pelagophyceae sp. CCMP2097]|nr:hypothetical protein M885DRAFT_590483 [Pelagophyceae sp. CCMP2097]